MKYKNIKHKIETGKFKIELIDFNPNVKEFIGITRIYVLKIDDKTIFLGYKNDIVKIFSKIMKDIYGERYFKEYPDCYFTRFWDKEYKKSKKKNKLTEIKKKPYYAKMRVLSKKNKIKRLQEEIVREKILLKELEN